MIRANLAGHLFLPLGLLCAVFASQRLVGVTETSSASGAMVRKAQKRMSCRIGRTQGDAGSVWTVAERPAKGDIATPAGGGKDPRDRHREDDLKPVIVDAREPNADVSMGGHANNDHRGIRATKIETGPDGRPMIVHGTEQHPPYILFIQTNERWSDRQHLVYEQVKKAARAGVHVVSLSTSLAPIYEFGSFTHLDKTVARILEHNPKALVIPRVWLGLGGSWGEEHPDQLLRFQDGSANPGMASVTSIRWKKDAQALLTKMIRHVEAMPWRDRIIGYHLAYYQSGEWFHPQQAGKWADYSKAARDGFSRWTKGKYGSDKALAAAWGKPMTFDTVAVPPVELRRSLGDVFVDPSTGDGRYVLDWREFFSASIADAVRDMCRHVKHETGGNTLTATFFGYVMAASFLRDRAVTFGHWNMHDVLNDPHIDIIASPYAYPDRGLGNPITFHGPLDSAPLSGKLWMIEDDTYTHLAAPPPHGIAAPGWEHRTTTLSETIEIVERNFGACATRNAGLWWMDLLSDGRFNDRAIWKRNRELLDLHQATPEQGYAPEVAVVVDAPGMTAYGKMAGDVIWSALGESRKQFGTLGTTVGYYLLQDVDKIPETTRLLIFVNAHAIADSEMRKLEDRAKTKGKTLLWLHAPGYVTTGGFSTQRMSRLTGMAIQRTDTGTLATRIGTTCEPYTALSGRSFGLTGKTLPPSFEVVDPEAMILGEADGKVTLARKELGDWTSIYCLPPNPPAWFLRVVAKSAGCHLYVTDAPEPGDGVYASPGIMFVHAGGDGTRRFSLPAKKDIYRWDGGSMTLIQQAAAEWSDMLKAKTTSIYVFQ